jgi:transposase-like protein
MEIYPRTLEAVKLIKECGVGYVQAARDLGVNRSVLRNWVKGFEADPPQRLRATVR